MLVKLDTNGSRPKIVKHLAEAGLIDKVAMDIKACPDNYGNLTGMKSLIWTVFLRQQIFCCMGIWTMNSEQQ